MSKIYGIDLGTRALKIYKKGTGVVYDEKNYIAIADESRIIAIGDQAFEMVGKAPSNISVTCPIRHGVIADINNMTQMLNRAFEKISEQYGSMKGSEFIITTPTDITEVERKAFVDLVLSTNVKTKVCRVIERPIANAFGAGLNITESKGVMVVDIGADTTEVSVLAVGGIVLSKLLKTGGNQLDENIINAVRKKYNLVIGNKTAETIKIALASAVRPFPSEIENIRVFGRDVVNGLPTEKTIDSNFVYEAINEQIEAIIDAVKLLIEKTPPEISLDILDSGIYITGGSAKIRKLSELFHNATNLKVHIGDDPSSSVVNGLGRLLDEPRLSALIAKLQIPSYKD